MTDKAEKKYRSPALRVMTAGLAEFTFMAAGLAVVLAGFVGINGFIGGVVRHEYESMTNDTAESAFQKFSGLEKSIDAMAVAFSLSDEGDRNAAIQKIAAAGAHEGPFDQIVLAYKNETGAWAFKILPGSRKENAYSLNPAKEALGTFVAQDVFAEMQTRFFTDENLFVYKGDKQEREVRPFAVARLVRTGEPGAGILIGVSRGDLLLDTGWVTRHEGLSRLGIRDPASGFELYRFGDGSAAYEQVYEIPFGEQKWEMRIGYLEKPDIIFLESMPFFFLIAGSALVLIGTVAIRNHKTQERRVRMIHRLLDQKNLEISEEHASRSRLQDALRKFESENTAVIDSVSDIIFETDTDGKIIFLNKTWQKITGFEVEQSQGLEIFKMLHQQDQEKQARDFQMLVMGQKEPYRTFTRLRTGDGTFRAVELAICMIRRDDKGVRRVVGTLTDVEERRRAERALSEAEKKYRAIVENAAGGIFQLTPEGVYLSVNPAFARIVGYDNAEDVLRTVKNANEKIYGNSRERQALLAALESRGVATNYEIQVVTRTGERIWVNENARVVRDDSGNTLYYEGSIEDISQRKAAEMALRDAKIRSDLANRAKSEFLANMSHELRTPLNSIIGFSEIIKNEVFGALGQPSYKEYANDIYESGRRLLTIISEILDIAKVEAGERSLNESIVNVAEVIRSSIVLLHNKAEANGLTVAGALDDMPNIIGEELAIKQIVVNLLSNAIKFTPHGGRISISSETGRDGVLRISFTDTGIGLDEHEIEKALSPFGQIDNAFNREGAGTGLGLTLVNALVSLHDGKLELFSKKGIGTTVTITFPPDRVVIKKPNAPVGETVV